jgi:hypothetical protein
VNSRALSRVTGVQAGTLNAWVQRGYVPGMEVEVSGRQRDFDVDTATHIAVMAEMMQLGFGAQIAAAAALSAHHEKRLLFAKRPIRAVGTPNFQFQGGFLFIPFKSEAKLPEALADFANQYPDFGQPSAFVVIDVERIAARIQDAEKEWKLAGKVEGMGLPVRIFSPSGERIKSVDQTPASKKTKS